jgi:methanogenic corrinoid protein MtbC1
MKIDELLIKTKELPIISLAATLAYKEKTPAMTKYVDEKLNSMPEIYSLIGNSDMQVLYDNHKHHAAFIGTVFSLGNYELLCKTIPWVYRSYHNHKFSYDYFPVELKAWKEAIDKYIDNNLATEIKNIYNWMIDNHEIFIELSLTDLSYLMPIGEDNHAVKSSFQSSLIDGDHQKCMAIALENIKTTPEMEPFYIQIIQPTMYEIGTLWERGELSVANEHLASAIIGRVMAAINMTTIKPLKSQGKIVVTASPNEFHEIGAWMVADILENEGWNVSYLGANVPHNDLIKFLLSTIPDVLAISVTMPFNIEKAREVIELSKKFSELENMKIIIGGRVFNDNPELWHSTGADNFAATILEAKEIIQQWKKK